MSIGRRSMGLPLKMQSTQETVKMPCRQYHLLNKGKNINIFIYNSNVRVLKIQVFCLGGSSMHSCQFWKTSFLISTNFVHEQSSTYIGCLKQRTPRIKTVLSMLHLTQNCVNFLLLPHVQSWVQPKINIQAQSRNNRIIYLRTLNPHYLKIMFYSLKIT